ncbi:uncharacterized protein CTRU02_211511 [Colletotrichum truncatum]|uniref:Uncharacterized protein n=1 Tax=Colletotrichum truncatum TaxID=5467 RepID=A0ACC3YKY3_COLTU|nr:uncharacterized protein CTRU02_13867 [Colletotrichum truncatum]KAF6782869.1 hypothetical protein CTRU02_13867 [Colletotrichum truncatum]
MLLQTTLAITTLLQFVLPTSAAFIFCAGAPADGSCPTDKGAKSSCENICANCGPNCFGGTAKDLGATCCTQGDGTINIFCFRTGKNNC